MANTIKTVGDAKLTDSIIDRSITEYEDDTISSIGDYGLYKCAALNTVKFPNATYLGEYALSNSGIVNVDLPLVDTLGLCALHSCKNLVKIILPSLNQVGVQPFSWCTKLERIDIGGESFSGFIDNNACAGCQSLKTIILRRTSGICTLLSNNCFNSDIKSPILNGTGYIYVPAALVDSYKSDSMWSKFANQIRAIEDYPEICNPYTWESVAMNIDNNTYKDVYKIGDTIPLDLGSEGVINMQIVAFDADNLADGSGKAPITWISKELLKNIHIMNPSLTTNYEYPESPSWTESASVTNQWSTKTQYCKDSVAKAIWTITAVTDGTLTISYKVGTSSTSKNKITITVDDAAIVTNDASATSFKTYDVSCVAGDTIIVAADYTLLSADNYTGYIKFESTGEINVSADIKNAPQRVSNGYKEGTGSIGGWEKSEMRAYLNDTILPMIPENVSSMIKSVTKYSNGYDVSGNKVNDMVTTDSVWIPSIREVFGRTNASITNREQNGVDYNELFADFKNKMKTFANFDADANANMINTTGDWWLRTAGSNNYFLAIRHDGMNGSYLTSSSCGIALGFCTGKMPTPLKITKQPEDVSIAAGEIATFSVEATGEGLTYQWEFRNNSNNDWVASSLYTTSTMKIEAINDRNGYQYRCKVTDVNGIVVYSDIATLNVVDFDFEITDE